jgi:O-antigen/teichoic acid export membrane protein
MTEDIHKDSHTTAKSNLTNISDNQDIFTAAKGSGILFAGRMFEQISRFVFAIVVARSIGAAGFGLYTLGMSVAFLLAAVAMLGLNSGMVRFLPIGLREGNQAWVRGILFLGIGLSSGMGLLLAVIIFGLASVIAAEFIRDPAAESVLRWISIVIPLEAVGRVLIADILGFKHVQYQVYSYSITFYAVKLTLTLLFLVIGLGIVGVIAAHAVAWVVAIGLLIYFLNRLIPLREARQLARKDAREIISFSAPLCLTEITIQLRSNIQLLLLGTLGTMVMVGVYGAASRIQSAGDMFLEVISKMSMPIISDLNHQAKAVQLRRLYQTLTRWSISFMLPFVITTILFAKPILGIFGEEFVSGVPVLIIVGLGLLVGASTRVSNSMITMTGHSRLTFLNTVAGLILNVFFSLLLIPTRGIVGAALASAFTLTVISITRLLQVFWLNRLWPYNRNFVKPFFASMVALVISYLASLFLPTGDNLIYLAINIVILWATYIFILLFLGLADEDQFLLSHAGSQFKTRLQRS